MSFTLCQFVILYSSLVMNVVTIVKKAVVMCKKFLRNLFLLKIDY